MIVAQHAEIFMSTGAIEMDPAEIPWAITLCMIFVLYTTPDEGNGILFQEIGFPIVRQAACARKSVEQQKAVISTHRTVIPCSIEMPPLNQVEGQADAALSRRVDIPCGIFKQIEICRIQALLYQFIINAEHANLQIAIFRNIKARNRIAYII